MTEPDAARPAPRAPDFGQGPHNPDGPAPQPAREPAPAQGPAPRMRRPDVLRVVAVSAFLLVVVVVAGYWIADAYGALPAILTARTGFLISHVLLTKGTLKAAAVAAFAAVAWIAHRWSARRKAAAGGNPPGDAAGAGPGAEAQ